MHEKGPSAFLLLTLPSATLTSPIAQKSGVLGVQCVTTPDDEVFLVLHLEDIEYPIDPATNISVFTTATGDRVYKFPPTESYSSYITLTVTKPLNAEALRDLETLEGLLTQYAANLQGSVLEQHEGTTVASPSSYTGTSDTPAAHNINREVPSDLRGRLVLVNQDNGDVVGEFDSKLKVNEDPQLGQKGHENDAVVIEIPDDTSGMSEEHPLQLFASAIPPDQQTWMTKGASVVSHAIAGGTNMLVTVISGASSSYIAHSKPVLPEPGKAPSRVAVFLSSEKTKKGISNVHAFTGQAVKVSAKTMGVIDSIITTTIGGKSEKPAASAKSAAPSINEKSGLPPPPYTPPISTSYAPYTSKGSSSLHVSTDGKPALPPRRSPSPSPIRGYSPSPTRGYTPSPSSTPPPALPPRNVGLIKRVILSADLILSTLEHSGKQLLDVSADSLGNIAGHRYGEAAGDNVRGMTGSARNVAVVYVDMRGIGRRALIKRVGKSYVKGKFSSSKK